MKEELIISGRMNPRIDPELAIWHWEIPFYLFVGGLAAGILFFASFYYLRGKANEMPNTVKWAPLLAPILLIAGLGALFLDLNHKLYFWQLYTTIKLQSPMSWGAWTLLVITPLSLLWCFSYLSELFPKWNWKQKTLSRFETYLVGKRKILAWIMVFFSVILGIYTGILLSAFNARPLWNTSILGPLFLTSGLSAGAAFILLISKNNFEKQLFRKIDLIIIGVELFFIIHMFMGFLASTQVQIDAAKLFLGGDYTLPFWIFVVFLGMIVPALLEYLEMKGQKIPSYIPAILVIFGSLMLRFIIVNAGQVSRYLY
ncbi:NrfD/PsrC family molybdoenzyme membrane anchor subunit [Flexithrix dorotheae]|uniref:NrfD/PsrC family molybdoenzyme membrane anchor subunit n=1 Tax=Flexithrix dorotheae TaxID=70993 RepID=UPI00037D96F8|nr:NrfD/PsrC family molybdoenzyme membrane anchor subunit [Flexithrix dorotheae]